MSEQIGRNCPSKIRTECCQLLLQTPEAEVSAGVKSPCDGSGSALSPRGNQRAWASGVGRIHSGESPKGYYSNVGVQALAAWVHRFVLGNRLNARSARRTGFGNGRAWKSTGLDVRRWSLEPKNVSVHLERAVDQPRPERGIAF